MPRSKLDEKAQIGGRIALLRGEETQEVFARRLGITSSNISRWELGDFYPSVAHVLIIAAACNVSLDWLLLGIEE